MKKTPTSNIAFCRDIQDYVPCLIKSVKTNSSYLPFRISNVYMACTPPFDIRE